MKKLLTIAAVAGMFAFVACGPSAEDKAKAEQHMKDSLRNDSMAKAQAAVQMANDEIRFNGC